MARCLRCGATSEWIEGRVSPEPEAFDLVKAERDLEVQRRLDAESKLASAEKELLCWPADLREEVRSLQSRLDECRESCARAVASRDVAQSRLSSCMNQLRRVASAERRDAFGGVRVWLHSEWMREIDEIVFPKESVVEIGRRDSDGTDSSRG